MLTYDFNFLDKNSSIKKYVEIMETINGPDFELTDAFKKKFNGFYRIGRRNKNWYKAFYGLFEDFLSGNNYNFGEVLIKLFKETGQIEPSFSSKLIHTFNPDLPIWDSIILKSLGLQCSDLKNDTDRIEEDILIYNQICNEFVSHINDEGVVEAITKFDLKFVKYKDKISRTKKLDFILWSNRANRFASVLELSKLQDLLNKNLITLVKHNLLNIR